MITINDERMCFEGEQRDLVAEYMAVGERLYSQLNEVGQFAFICSLEKLCENLIEYDNKNK